MQSSEGVFKKSKKKEDLLPVIICLQDNANREGDFYITAHNKKLLIGRNFLLAVDVLLKLHLIFELEVHPDVQKLFSFIQEIIMEYPGGAPSDFNNKFKNKLDNLN